MRRFYCRSSTTSLTSQGACSIIDGWRHRALLGSDRGQYGDPKNISVVIINFRRSSEGTHPKLTQMIGNALPISRPSRTARFDLAHSNSVI